MKGDLKSLKLIFLLSVVCLSLRAASVGTTESEGNLPTSSYQKDQKIYVLTQENIKQAIEEFGSILIDFFAPWCIHCVNMAAEYTRAGDLMAKYDDPIAIAKIDCQAYQQTCREYGISGYPSIKLFSKGESVDFHNARTAESFVSWTRKRIISPSVEVKTQEKLDTFKQVHKVLVVYLGKKNHDFEMFLTLASQMDSVEFMHMFNEEETAKVVVYTYHSEPVIDESSPLELVGLRAFVERYKYPLLMEFKGQEAIDTIFTHRKPGIFFFRDEETHQFQETFEKIANKERGNTDHPLVYFYSTITIGEGIRFTNYIGLNTALGPQIFIIQNENGQLKKFKLEGEFTEESVQKFVDKWRHEAAPQYFKSQRPPVVDLDPVRTIVRDTFDDLVYNNDKFVIVNFYAPWCNFCKLLDPIWKQLGKGLNYMEHLRIGKVDATENEISDLPVKSYPTIYLFKPGDKKNPLIYSGKREVDEFIVFLKKEMGDQWEEVPEDLTIEDL